MQANLSIFPLKLRRALNGKNFWRITLVMGFVYGSMLLFRGLHRSPLLAFVPSSGAGLRPQPRTRLPQAMPVLCGRGRSAWQRGPALAVAATSASALALGALALRAAAGESAEAPGLSAAHLRRRPRRRLRRSAVATAAASALRTKAAPSRWKLCMSIWALLGGQERLLLAGGGLSLVATAGAELMIPNLVASGLFAVVNQRGRAALLSSVGLLMLSASLQALFNGLRGLCFQTARNRFVTRLREQCFDAFLARDMGFYDEVDAGELTSRLSADCQVFFQSLDIVLNYLLRSTTTTIVGFAMLVRISPRLTLCVSAVCVVWLASTEWYGLVTRRASRSTQDALAELNRIAEEGPQRCNFTSCVGFAQKVVCSAAGTGIIHDDPLKTDGGLKPKSCQNTNHNHIRDSNTEVYDQSRVESFDDVVVYTHITHNGRRVRAHCVRLYTQFTVPQKGYGKRGTHFKLLTYKLFCVVERFLKVINLIWLELLIARSACFSCYAMPLPFTSLHLALATVPPFSPALGLQVALQVWVPSCLCLVPSPRLPIILGCPGSVTSPRICRDSNPFHIGNGVGRRTICWYSFEPLLAYPF